MKIKFAIWTAVSTSAQATEDKVSLKAQEQKCREYARSQGWLETAGPYVANGYSRTGYTDLTDAIVNIPPLGDALRDVGKYDVLIMFSYDRMGDVLPMLSVKFRQLSKQIFSVSQPAPLQDPKRFDPYNNEGAVAMQALANITQQYRINDIRRKWNAGVPKRAERGLHPLSLPYGYAVAGKGEPARIIPEQAALVRKMKDWFLEGLNYAEICRRSNEIAAPARSEQWHIAVVRRMLINPFYAGLVRFGKYKTVQGRRVDQPRSTWILEQGQHEPLWTEDTHYQIVAEHERRKEMNQFSDAKYPYTGLTFCGECGGKISRHGGKYKNMSCNTSYTHWAMNYKAAENHITNNLIRALIEREETPPQPIDKAQLEMDIKACEQEIERVQRGYLSGVFDDIKAPQLISEAEEKKNLLVKKLEAAKEADRVRASAAKQLTALKAMAQDLPGMIQDIDPTRINHEFSKAIKKIILYKDKIDFVLRDTVP